MKKLFRASLCYQGLRGGAISVDAEAVAYRNQTLTLPEKYKNIVMPIEEIVRVEKGFAAFFPTVTIYLKNDRQYRFVIFSRNKFIQCLKQVMREASVIREERENGI